MIKFKIGDRVKCINNDDTISRLKLGDIYVVSRVDKYNNAIVIKGSKISWWDKRFVLVEECVEEFQIW